MSTKISLFYYNKSIIKGLLQFIAHAILYAKNSNHPEALWTPNRYAFIDVSYGRLKGNPMVGVIGFICFMIAPAVLLYAVVRIIFGKVMPDRTSNDFGAYNAIYIALIAGAVIFFGDYYVKSYKTKMCFEEREYLERSVENCVADAQLGVIENLFYNIIN